MTHHHVPCFDFRAGVAQCWTTQLLLLLGMLLLSLMQSAIRDDFTNFLVDPGEKGWRLMCVLIPLYAVMPVLVRLHESRWFGWFNTVLLPLTSLLPLGHQMRHFLEGKPFDMAVLLEATMVVLAFLGGVLAARWARCVAARP